MQSLGAAIYKVRKERGLTRNGFHYLTRISYPSIARIERGEVYPGLATILCICQVLEIKPSALFAMAEER